MPLRTRGRVLGLTKTDLKKLGELRPERGAVDGVLQVALLLSGVRDACRCEEEERAFFDDVLKRFDKKLGCVDIDAGEPVLYRLGAVTGSDLNILRGADLNSTKAHAAYARIFGYVGTAYPCSSHEDALLAEISVVLAVGSDRDRHRESVVIVPQCIHAREVGKWFKSFEKFRKRMLALDHVRIGKFEVLYAQCKACVARDRFAA